MDSWPVAQASEEEPTIDLEYRWCGCCDSSLATEWDDQLICPICGLTFDLEIDRTAAVRPIRLRPTAPPEHVQAVSDGKELAQVVDFAIGLLAR